MDNQKHKTPEFKQGQSLPRQDGLNLRFRLLGHGFEIWHKQRVERSVSSHIATKDQS